MMDAGNVLRKHTLEMRKRCIFLESEKKQLTDKVHTLHTSMKALRESKDRMISERLRALQVRYQFVYCTHVYCALFLIKAQPKSMNSNVLFY